MSSREAFKIHTATRDIILHQYFSTKAPKIGKIIEAMALKFPPKSGANELNESISRIANSLPLHCGQFRLGFENERGIGLDELMETFADKIWGVPLESPLRGGPNLEYSMDLISASNGPYYGPYKVNRNGNVISTNVPSS
ncbi:uncharacterized protein BDR25DRAFT_352619 [Lindgomyces ingoldianus]|uniref:Uncharacterized protein n=1 Tax=Lindgomyces ingoldianus TaxID=673940 RepID=A0ACB6R1P0_9PLEO|nr:uncharacterized protein BDR25DRAFT_352619 [Lindgomyces ingoldianus]KAF2473174.1 hypothetical protein BDR25DRAFT_352619 [Lindgomyces ingoldianus]